MKLITTTLSAILFACLMIIMQACSSNNGQSNVSTENTVLIPVEAGQVNRGDISAFYANTATLEAEQEATVVSKVRGIIKELYVEEGDNVQAGQIIAKIDDEQYQLEVNNAKATLDRLQNNLSRSKELFDRNLVSAEAYQNAKFEYESQKATFELSVLNLENSSVRSPIKGTISERFVKKGNMIGTDQQLYRVTDFSRLKAVLHVPEHEMSKIRNNQRAELRADAIPNELFVGYVERISPVVDSQSGTFRATVYIDETRNMLRPGMFSRVRIVYDTRQNSRLIPRSAIISEDLNKSVFVVRDSLVFKRSIQTGYTNGQSVEVIDGLEDNEIVVTIGQGSLQDSTKVNIINSALLIGN
ncbi:efflux RND transporter periplasmic adaptor subunit [Rhodohalobacter sp. SW132]|uniref:efflux RND transporter periplasmic adaptor subunit n=1 Tax=Rhodohalobacter sp. SW132 TaxID=2293433 RepID=UPI000E26010E|nr:efflux RND transporter periplasmic adaptor subunit [Rhodohalobacter sp. SW132]REL32958.1 efflux RND transporter periplasmic adaptor subunit [Rhodohalobacter sp. SW132]